MQTVSFRVGIYPVEILLEVQKAVVNTRIITAALFLLANQVETTLNTISKDLDKKFLYIKVVGCCAPLQMLKIEMSMCTDMSVGPG